MAHNAYIRNPPTNWTVASAIGETEIESLDINLSQAINGTDGGTWAPQNQIQIGGAGMLVIGPTVIARGGRLSCLANGIINFDEADFPQYNSTHSGRTRTFVYACARGRGTPHFGWRVRWDTGAMQSIAPQLDQGNGPQPVRFWVPVRAHDQSTLSQVTVNFRIGFTHTSVPPLMPMARVVRFDASGHPTPLTSQAAGGDANGYVQAAKPANLAAWSGQKSIVLTCDQNNSVDISQFTYAVEIVEEGGIAGYPWTLKMLLANGPFQTTVTTALWASSANLDTSTSLSSVDGSSPANGDTVLVKDNNDKSFNGVWRSSGSGTAPAERIWPQASADFSAGILIPVEQSNSAGGTYWQAFIAGATNQVTGVTLAPWVPGTARITSVISSFYNNGANIHTWAPSIVSPGVAFAVVPTAHNGYWYIAGGAGTAAGSEPSWPRQFGATVVDGGITWTCAGTTSSSLGIVGRSNQDDETQATAGTALFAHGNIWQSCTAVFTGISDGHFQ